MGFGIVILSWPLFQRAQTGSMSFGSTRNWTAAHIIRILEPGQGRNLVRDIYIRLVGIY